MIMYTTCPIRGMNFFSDNDEDYTPTNRRQRRGKKVRKSNNSRPRSWKR